MGMSGKPEGFNGGNVAQYCLEGRIKEVADYCETDIINTYRVWLRYELFRGNLTPTQFKFSEQKLGAFIKARSNAKPHLAEMVI
jgi:predicted PolB exonuclease-like 3'-5' exonuclease